MAKDARGDNRVKADLDELRRLVEKFIELGDVKKKDLAKEAGVSLATVHNFLRGDKMGYRYATVNKIMFAVCHAIRPSNPQPPTPPSKKRRSRKA
jgi:predicted transcriptional regulator